MKKRLFVLLALALAVMCGYAMEASACHLTDVNLTAECVDDGVGNYSIEYCIEATRNFAYNYDSTVTYEFTITGTTVYTVSGSIAIPAGQTTASYCGSVQVDCDDYEINGSATLGGTIFFGPQEVVCTCDTPGDEGCTPGFWKNHLDAWEGTGFYPDDDFDAAFGVDLFYPDITLYEAVWARGGGNNKIARHGTAALLNAASENVEYPVSIADVIQAVQDGDVESLVNYNEYGTEGFCD